MYEWERGCDENQCKMFCNHETITMGQVRKVLDKEELTGPPSLRTQIRNTLMRNSIAIAEEMRTGLFETDSSPPPLYDVDRLSDEVVHKQIYGETNDRMVIRAIIRSTEASPWRNECMWNNKHREERGIEETPPERRIFRPGPSITVT